MPLRARGKSRGEKCREAGDQTGHMKEWWRMYQALPGNAARDRIPPEAFIEQTETNQGSSLRQSAARKSKITYRARAVA